MTLTDNPWVEPGHTFEFGPDVPSGQLVEQIKRARRQLNFYKSMIENGEHYLRERGDEALNPTGD